MSDRPARSIGFPVKVTGRTLLGCCLLICGFTLAATASAQTRIHEQTSLRFIPDDAAYYSASFRLKEQFQAFARSKALAKLLSLPLIKSGIDELKSSFEEGFVGAASKSDDDEGDEKQKKEKNPKARKVEANDASEDEDAEKADGDGQEMLRQFYAFWTDPATQKLTNLALDALSHEIFMYGDKGSIDFLRELQKLNLDMNQLALSGAGQDKTSVQAQIQPLLDRLDTLPVPAFVLGFKTTNPAGVSEQITALESWLRTTLSDYPKLLDGLRREKVEGNEFLNLTLKGEQIPWKELLDEDDDDDADDGDKADDEVARAVIESLSVKLKNRSLTLSLGVAEGYLLISFGEKKAQLVRMFEKGRRLSDRPEFEPLRKFPESPFTSISYVSAEMNKQILESSNAVDSIKDGLDRFGPLLGIAEEAREKLVKDIKDLTEEAAAMGPKAGAILGWNYQTPRGFEGYWYDYGGGNKTLDGSKPLSILGHVGKSPLVVVAARHKNQLATYQFAVKSLGLIAGDLETILSPHVPPPYDTIYSRLKEEFAPVAKEFYKITSEQLIPALADGQSAFVLESRSLKIDQIPQREPGPLPFPLPALVYGVTDAKLLQKACGGYFNLIQQSITILSRVFPEQVPPFVIPPPAERKVGEQRLFVYPVIGAEGSADEVAATAGLGNDFATLGLSPAQAQELLATQGTASSGVLKRADRPAARAWSVNIAGITQMLGPWVDFAMDASAEQAAQVSEDPAEIAKTIKGVLEFISCWRGASGIQYVEQGALVHYYESVFEDAK